MDEPKDEERRTEKRKTAAFEVFCSAGREEGAAKLFDVSLMGARLESADIKPAVGDPVTILFQSAPDADSEVVSAIVARLTESGFAVEFRVVSPAVLRIVERYGKQ